MKKILHFFFMIALLASLSRAQMVVKNISDHTLFQINNLADVTIGSAQEDGSLTVIGSARITQFSNLTQPDKVLVTDDLGTLSAIVGASSGQILKWNGSVWILSSDAVNDSDHDPTNERQTLSQGGSSTISTLDISDGNSITLYKSLLPNVRRDNLDLNAGAVTGIDFDLGESGIQAINLNFAAHSGSGYLYVLKGNYSDELAYGCASAGNGSSTSAYFVPVYYQGGTTYRVYIKASGNLKGNFSVTGLLY